MTVPFKKQLVPKQVEIKRSYGRGNPVDYIVIHQTGNTNRGANAQTHANLQSRLNPRQASWHETVDDKQAIQSFDDSVMCWSATDGRGPGNTRGYHIEICINSDGDYKKAVENGAKRAAIKLKEHGLDINRLKQHADFYPKNCPAQIRAGKDGITWSKFRSMVKAFMDGEKVKPAPKVKAASKPTSNNTKLVVDGLWGPATTRALQREFGTTEDGVISGQPNNSSTRNIPSVRFGKGGSDLVQAMQKWLGTPQDRIISNPSMMIRALQIKLGMKIVDGKISKPSNVVREMQRRLNEGGLK